MRDSTLLPRLLRYYLPALALLTMAVGCIHRWSGAHRAELLGDSDESAHYVTGLMVHDYLVRGLGEPPLAFAEKFHLHYPRVALGHWPPGFYALQAAWMLICGTDRAAILWLCAVIAAAWIFMCERMFEENCSRPLAWAGALFVLGSPEVLSSSRLVMSDILMAALTLASVWTLARLIDQPCARWSLAFGLLSATAILTKATGVLLAPLPLLAVLTFRRWDLLRSPWLWLPAGIVLVLCTPWYALVPYALHEKMAPYGDPGMRIYRVTHTLKFCVQQLGIPGALLTIVGWWRLAVKLRRGERVQPLLVLAAWVLPAAIACRLFIGAWEAKHLITVTPFLVLSACCGLSWMLDSIGARRSILAAITAVWALLTVGQHVAAAPLKPHRGLDLVAASLLQRPELVGRRVVIVSDAAGEGAFVSEMAMRDNRPRHVVERGAKLLTDYTRMGRNIRPRFHSSEALQRDFDEKGGAILILDPITRELLGLRMAKVLVAAAPGRWRELMQQPRLDLKAQPGAEPIRVYLLEPKS